MERGGRHKNATDLFYFFLLNLFDHMKVWRVWVSMYKIIIEWQNWFTSPWFQHLFIFDVKSALWNMHHRDKRFCPQERSQLLVYGIFNDCTLLHHLALPLRIGISEKASWIFTKCGSRSHFPVGDQAYCKMHAMTVVWERQWMTWGERRQGRHSKHVFKNADLSFTFYSLAPSPPLYKSLFPRKSGMFVAPTVLVMEKTIHAHCQRVFVCWMKSLLPLPPCPNTLD